MNNVNTPRPIKLRLQRISAGPVATLGHLATPGGDFATLEDPIRKHKIHGITCIPPGRFRLLLRKEGGMHVRYSQRFPAWHRGMLWLQDVPEFEYVYIHIGNYPKDTEGCILVGRNARRDAVYHSQEAYKLIYQAIAPAIDDGAEAWVEVLNPPEYRAPDEDEA